MSGGVDIYFVDTNVFLYALDARSPAKQPIAAQWINGLWSSGLGRLSWQVLHEFYANAVGKMRLDIELARSTARMLTQWQPLPMSAGVHERAWAWMDASKLSYWDALIVASAERCEVQCLLSEDFQHGQQYGPCRVVNPFRTAPPWSPQTSNPLTSAE